MPASINSTLKGQRSYIIKDLNGVKYRRNRIHIKPRYKNNDFNTHNHLPMRSDYSQGIGNDKAGHDRQMEDKSEVNSKSSQPYITKYGRTVKPTQFYTNAT